MVAVYSKLAGQLNFDSSKPWQVVAVTFGAIAVTYVAYRVLAGDAKSANYKNPFAKNAIRPLEPMVTDHSVREKRIKKQFSPELIPTNLDAIIIGSGIGGLTVASILSKIGKKVLVLEQHGKVGGWTHVFIKDDTEFDVGIHYVGKMGKGEFNRFVIDQLTEGQLDWQEMADDYDNVTVGNPEKGQLRNIPIYKDPKKLEASLVERYPEHASGIREYFRLVRATHPVGSYMAVFKLAPRWLCRLMYALSWPFIPSLHRFFNYFWRWNALEVAQRLCPGNPELHNVLGYCWGDSGSPPNESSFGLVAAIFNHYSKGAFYPVGGAGEISYNIVPTIEKSGGQVLMKARVKEIILSQDGRTAVGVRVEAGKGKTIDIRAPLIISDAGVPNTFLRLLPPQVSEKTELGRLVRSGRLHPSIAMVQVFIGLQGSQEDLELPSRNYWVTYDYSTDDLFKWNQLSLEEASKQRVPMMFLGFPSAKDDSYRQRYPDRSACIAITIVPSKWFKEWNSKPKGKRGEDYNSYKMAIAEQVWEQVVEMFPQLSSRRRYFDAGTPVTAEHYAMAIDGESYGLDHGQDRFSPEILMALRPPVREIKNLYLTGQDMLTCGFSSAMTGGLMCAHSILADSGENKNMYGDLGKLFKACHSK